MRASLSLRRGLVLVVAGYASATAACSGGGPSSSGAPVASVAIAPDTLRLLPGERGRLGAALLDSAGTAIRGRTIYWSSADTTVAVIDQDGMVTARRAGAVQISANVEGRSDVAVVIVRASGPASVTVDPPTASVVVGATTPLVATVRDGRGDVLTDRAPTWSSGNSAVATVNQQGVVTGVSPGTATIIASRDGITGSSTVTVLRVPVARVVVSPSSVEVKLGRTFKFSYKLYDAQNRELTGRLVTWSSNNPAIASVASDGTVTAKLLGSVTITATSEGQTGTAQVMVKL